ncbi:MAG TPA: 2-dehydropantoate 2-reductase [Ramlibacter sp.]|nr:2-dehydropantoate 2-reductase [Ramlibacter sp.]
MTTRIAIVGAGAVGAYVGAHMVRAGEDVILVDAYPDHVRAMQTRGVAIEGVVERDRFTVPVRALHVSEVQCLSREPAIDMAFIGVKAYDTPWACALVQPYLASGGIAMSMQNGLNDHLVAAVVGWERTLGVTISGCGVDLHAPGRVKRSNASAEGQTVFRVGEINGMATHRASEAARLMGCADHAAVISNLWGERWSKLVVNAMRMGLAALTRIYIPDQDRDESTRAVMIRLGAEALRVGIANGYVVEKVQGIPARVLLAAADGDSNAIEETTRLLLEFASRYADTALPSLAQDIVKGRRTEIDQINGLVVQKGMEAGIPTPANARVLELTRKLERGEIKAGRHALDWL